MKFKRRKEKSLFYKKCEECETNINKLQSWWNIFLLKTGTKLKCSNCGTEYKTNKIISFFGNIYAWSGISLFVLFLCTSLFWEIFEKVFNKKFGGEMWIYTFIILSVIEFMVMVILPLKKIENKKEGK